MEGENEKLKVELKARKLWDDFAANYHEGLK
jgi:hypothetical protein